MKYFWGENIQRRNASFEWELSPQVYNIFRYIVSKMSLIAAKVDLILRITIAHCNAIVKHGHDAWQAEK